MAGRVRGDWKKDGLLPDDPTVYSHHTRTRWDAPII